MSSPAELAIRLNRAAFNQALATARLDAIEPLLAPDAILVAGSDSALLSGRKAQLQAWRREFAAADRTVYTRTPDTILVSPVEPIALEQGDWRGVMIGGRTVASGRYSAKWRELMGQWVIEAEIYLTLA